MRRSSAVRAPREAPLRRGARVQSSVNPRKGQYRPHARLRLLRVAQQAGTIRQAQDLRQVHDGARALLAADHFEMTLVPVEVGKEHHAGLVEARWRAKDVARKRYGWFQNSSVAHQVHLVERRQRCRGSWSNRIENTE